MAVLPRSDRVREIVTGNLRVASNTARAFQEIKRKFGARFAVGRFRCGVLD